MFHKLFQLKTPAKLSFRPRTEVVTEGLSMYVMFLLSFSECIFCFSQPPVWFVFVETVCSFTVYMSDMSDVHVHCWSAA